MKVREVMTSPVVRIHPGENAAVAARAMDHYNVGILPVCGADGHVRGLVTDRDLVTRCMAAGRTAAATRVEEVMTHRICSIHPDADTEEAARIMGAEQVRRLPVTENGRLLGMVSLGDLSHLPEAHKALSEIAAGVSRRGEKAPETCSKKNEEICK